MDEEIVADDIMPNDATFLGANQDQDEEVTRQINTEKAMVQAARPLFDHILAWFDVQIAQADSIGNIDAESRIDITIQILAAQSLKERLIRAKSDLEVMAQNHL